MDSTNLPVIVLIYDDGTTEYMPSTTAWSAATSAAYNHTTPSGSYEGQQPREMGEESVIVLLYCGDI